MSVSLRENLEITGCLIGYTGKNLIGKFMGEAVVVSVTEKDLREQHPELFPAQLTRFEIYEIIAKNQQGMTGEQINKIAVALATPTFSGGKNKKRENAVLCKRCVNLNTHICNTCEDASYYNPTEQKCGPGVSGNFGPIPAEKKEKPFPISKCCNASVHVSGIGDFEGDKKACTQYYVCDKCGEACDLAEWNKEAEKKDVPNFVSNTHFGDICSKCGCEKILHNCPDCGMKQPEPKPKDRIEPLDEVDHQGRLRKIDSMRDIQDKINTIIRHINKES